MDGAMNLQRELESDELIQTVKEVFGLTSLDYIGITSKRPIEIGPNLSFSFAENQVLNEAWRASISRCLREEKMFWEAQKWDDCGKKAIVLQCCDNPDHLYMARYRCDLRICPRDGWRYAKKVLKRYKRRFKELLHQGRRQGKRFRFLTLTKKNAGQPLTQDGNREFGKQVGKLIRRFYDGAVCSIEVGPQWNLHAHCIVFGNYEPQDKLSKTWLKITGNSKVVDIRRVKGGMKTLLKYILKYVSKPCHFDRPEDYASYLKAIRGTRRVHSYGVLYGSTVTGVPKEKARCPQCGGELRYSRELSRAFSIMIIRFHFGIKPYSLAMLKAKVAWA